MWVVWALKIGCDLVGMVQELKKKGRGRRGRRDEEEAGVSPKGVENNRNFRYFEDLIDFYFL